MIRPALIILSALSLTACDGLAVLEGKSSPFKAETERRADLTSAFVAPPIQEPAQAAIEVAAPVPEPCFDVFRVTKCVDGVAQPWGGM